MAAKPVNTKQDFYQRFYRGEFGNHGPMWENYTSYVRSNYPGKIAIRCLTPGGRCDYNIPRLQVENRVADFQSQGYTKLNFSAMAPDGCITLQGELCRTHRGLELFYSMIQRPMRIALREDSHTLTGLRAKLVLQSRCNTSGYEWLMYLLDTYVGHTIEFSVFSKPWGVLKGHNTVIWEVRNY